MTYLVIGCGYLGHRVARLWRDAGCDVMVVTRRHERADELAAEGFHSIVGDVTEPETLDRLPQVDVTLLAIPAGAATRTLRAPALDTAFGSLSDGRLIFISTTGVYGDAGGEWVDENTPPKPARTGGRASLAAEQAIGHSPISSHTVILRSAGMYGPGRVPFLHKLVAGESIPAPENGWLNLIHIDDLAAVVVAAADHSSDPEGPSASETAGPVVFNVTDGIPVVRGDFYGHMARQLGAPPPRFISPDPDSPRAQRATVNRRVSNERMRLELGVSLRYRSYREGLAAIMAE